MSTEKFANNAQTTLASDLSSGSTTLTVVDGSAFPLTPQFRIRIDDELLLVTNVSSGTWAVERAKEGTSAVSHAAGATVVQLLTAGVMTDLVNSIVPPPVIGATNDFRITTLTGEPIPTDQPSASTLYWCPMSGGGAGQVALPDRNSSGNVLVTLSQQSLTLASLTTDSLYDLWGYVHSDGNGYFDLGTAWTNALTRSLKNTPNGAFSVNETSFTSKIRNHAIGAGKARLLGTIRATSSTTTVDSQTKRFVWNVNNQVPRKLLLIDSSTWTLQTTTIQAAHNNSSSNRVEVVTGLNGSIVQLTLSIAVENAANNAVIAGIGKNSTTTFGEDFSNRTWATGAVSVGLGKAFLTDIKPYGYHFYSWNEKTVNAASECKVYGNNAASPTEQSGLIGWVMG
jgi:hypothetical protein